MSQTDKFNNNDDIVVDPTASTSSPPSSFQYKHILYNCFRKILWLPPFLGGILIPVTVFSIYFFALYKHQVDAFLPYISEVGTLKPQAAFFSQLLDFIALFECLTFFLRYKQLKFQLKNAALGEKNSASRLFAANWLSLWVGLGHCGLVVIIGNFRAKEWQALHLMAAVSSFFMYFLYSTLTTYVLEHLYRAGEETRPTTIKATIVVMLIGMMGGFGTLLLSFYVVGGDVYDSDKGLQWGSSDLGDTIHDISAIFQWIIFLSVSFNLLCTSRRMYHFKGWNSIKFTV